MSRKQSSLRHDLIYLELVIRLAAQNPQRRASFAFPPPGWAKPRQPARSQGDVDAPHCKGGGGGELKHKHQCVISSIVGRLRVAPANPPKEKNDENQKD
jgi:hypothetical protein